jgi:hypothetical protein
MFSGIGIFVLSLDAIAGIHHRQNPISFSHVFGTDCASDDVNVQRRQPGRGGRSVSETRMNPFAVNRLHENVVEENQEVIKVENMSLMNLIFSARAVKLNSLHSHTNGPPHCVSLSFTLSNPYSRDCHMSYERSAAIGETMKLNSGVREKERTL